MALIVSISIAFMIGWFLEALWFSSNQSSSAVSKTSKPEGSTSLWAIFSRRAVAQTPEVPPAPQAPNKANDKPRNGIIFANAGQFFFVLAFIIVIFYNILFYIDLRSYAYISYLFYKTLLTPTIALIIGFSCRRHRFLIASKLDDFYNALLGSDKHSSWALQAAFATIALAIIALALNPRLIPLSQVHLDVVLPAG